jgi:hypothetical protein
MNKVAMIETYITFLKKHHLIPSEVILVAGSACVLHGVRESADDIDVQVTPEVYAKLKEHGVVIESTLDGCGLGQRLVIGDFDIMVSNYPSTLVDGVGVMTLIALKEMKKVLFQRLSREKDERDLIMIERLLMGGINGNRSQDKE